MINIDATLKQAHGFFTAKQYDKAMFLYSQVSSLDSKNQEFQLYCIFCDIASENDEQGQSLFDYFTLALEEDSSTAIKYVTDLINSYDGNNNKIMTMLSEFSNQNIDQLDAITYDDFEVLVKQRGSFKIAFQDIMFSTKVAISSKDEFYEFINQLIDNDFKTTAYDYLDGLTEYFKYDTQMIELYNKLGSKSIEHNSK